MIRVFYKLSKKDKAVILLTLLVGVVTCVILLYKLLSGTLIDFSGFPKSILQDDPRLQTYHYYDYKDFSTEIQFPGTDFGISVGGKELSASEYGAAFQYDDDIYIIVAEIKDSDNTASYVSEHFYGLISGTAGESQSEYKVKTHDDGFLNTVYLEYEGGILKNGKDCLYVITYSFNLEGNQLAIAFACRDKAGLQKCFYLLNHMFCTLIKYGESEGNGSAAGSTEVSSNSVSITAPTIELIEDGEDSGSLDESIQRQERDDYALAYPDAGSIKETTWMNSDLTEKTVAFVFEYTFGGSTPSSAVLRDPSGKEYSPNYMNDENDGRIVYVVEKPEAGTWEIDVADDVEIGQYSFHSFDYMDYMDVIKNVQIVETDEDGKEITP